VIRIDGHRGCERFHLRVLALIAFDCVIACFGYLD
jgi:hypothetical protein